MIHFSRRTPGSLGRSTIHSFVLLGYLLLTMVMTWPLVTQLTTAIPGDSFDGWQNYWNLWWLKTALVERQQTPFVTDLLYYPTGVGLYFHTLNPFNGLFTLPIQLSSGLFFAYNTVVFFSWTLAGYGVYLLTRWLLGIGYWVLDKRDHPVSIDVQKKIRVSIIFRRGTIYRASTKDYLTVYSIQYPIVAFVAGAIFTFAPFHMAHLLGHMQVMSFQWIPFYILYLLKATTHSRRGTPWVRQALMAGLFLTLTGLCDWYFVLYLFFFTGLVVLWQFLPGCLATPSQSPPEWGRSRYPLDRTTDPAPSWGGTQRVPGWGFRKPTLERARTGGVVLQNLKSAILPPLLAGALMLFLLSPVLIPMIGEALQFSFMVRPTTDLYIFSASVLDFLAPNRLHTLFRPASLTWPGNQIAPVSERTISIGYVPLFLALVAIWRWRPQTRFWLVAATFFLLLALGPRLHFGNITETDIPLEQTNTTPEWTPFALLNRTIPFMHISRSVSRYALMVQLCMAVLAGMGLNILLQRRRPVIAALLASFALLFILAEFWVAPYPMSPPDTPAYYTQLRDMPEVRGILNLPMNYDRPGYLLYQTVHQKPLAVAYISRDDPRTLTERIPVLQHFRHLGPDIIDVDPIAVGRTVLTDLGIDLVIQDRYKMPGGLERSYTEELANAIFADTTPLYGDERITVHRVQPPTTPVPYLVLGALHWGPLEKGEGGQRQRALIGQPATLQLHHVPPRSQLRLRYRTLPGVTLQIRPAVGLPLTTLPPAPAGNTVIVDLTAHRTPNRNNPVIELALLPAHPTGVWIESLAITFAPAGGR